MKTDIHPEYMICKVHCSCGNEFETRATVATLRLELCSECHPFYTGKQKLVDTGGRVERYQRRLAQTAKVQKKLAAPKVAPQYGTKVPAKKVAAKAADKSPTKKATEKATTKKAATKAVVMKEPAMADAAEASTA